jgi:pimeloyl-ACP methyl ester carboxylesterase
MFNLYERNQPLVVSDRADLTSNSDISKSEQYAAYLSRDKFFSSLKSQRVLVLIHGFNSTTSDAIKHYEQVSKDVGSSYDQVIYYLWPGGKYGLDKASFGEIERNATTYSGARERVKDVLKERLASFLSGLRRQTKSIDILAHSMGCRLTLAALSSIPLPPQEQFVRYVYLMGAAVRNQDLDVGHEYYGAGFQCRNIYVFFSRNDPVLRNAFPLGESTTSDESKKILEKVMKERIQRSRTFTGVIQNIQMTYYDEWILDTAKNFFKTKALGFSGPKGKRNQDIISVDVSKEVTDHSGYYKAPLVLSTLQRNAEISAKMEATLRIPG